MRGLYAIIDIDVSARAGLGVVDFASLVLEVRPGALQLRGKGASVRETCQVLSGLVPLCRRAGVPVFVNDRPDIAILTGCDGVHVGQTDLTVAEVRRFSRQLLVGVSTHSAYQLDEALATAPDYVAYGPVFPTQTKTDAESVVGIEGLEAAQRRAHARGVDLVAIGGITPSRLPDVTARVACAAMISGLIPAQLTTETLRTHLREIANSFSMRPTLV